ncbi:MAG: YqgE/AlgH family protein [Alphaproteobacteria bacterium]|nr:MAG: YqgE/AlgH family protein [Alphaproteobacteria bacterium]
MLNFYNFQHKQSYQGIFFASSPFINNRSFLNTVIFVTEDNQTLVYAIKINKLKFPREIKFSHKIHDGGLLERDKIVMIHDKSSIHPNSIQVSSKSDDIFCLELNEETNFQTQRCFVVSGYNSWVYSDFMKEIKCGDWIPVGISSSLMFDIPLLTRWHEAYRLSGICPEFIQPGSIPKA